MGEKWDEHHNSPGDEIQPTRGGKTVNDKRKNIRFNGMRFVGKPKKELGEYASRNPRQTGTEIEIFKPRQVEQIPGLNQTETLILEGLYNLNKTQSLVRGGNFDYIAGFSGITLTEALEKLRSIEAISNNEDKISITKKGGGLILEKNAKKIGKTT